MNRHRPNILNFVTKKIAVFALIAISTVGAYATLGDGNKKNGTSSLLSNKKTNVKPGTFSLRSGYNFRGNQVLNNSNKKYISITTTVMVQRGNSTVLVPLKKNVLVSGTGGVKLNLSRR